MKKDFYKWNKVKERVNNDDSSKSDFKECDIWWIFCGANVGFEQDGKGNLFMRPVLIFRKFSRNTCWVIPLSTKISRGDSFFPLLSESNILRMASLTQMRMIDVKRLINKVDKISYEEHVFVKEKIIDFIR